MHSSTWGGHSGIHATYQKLKSIFYWPKMIKDVKTIVQECEICQRNKDESVAYPGLLQPLPIPEGLGSTYPWTSLRVYQSRMEKMLLCWR